MRANLFPNSLSGNAGERLLSGYQRLGQTLCGRKGSVWVRALFEHQPRLAAANLGYVEAVAALRRRLPGDDWERVQAQLSIDWQNMMQLETSRAVIERAVILARQFKLRGADAVHLAAALLLHELLAEVSESVVLVASDDELLSTAELEGLHTENPCTGDTTTQASGIR